MSTNVSFVKHNRTRVKVGNEEESRRLLFEFFDGLGKIKGMKGYVILENARTEQEIVIITFWESKEDMDMFYGPSNKALAGFVEKSKNMLEQMPERNDYRVLRIKM